MVTWRHSSLYFIMSPPTWIPTEPLVFGILHHILPKKNQRNPLFYWLILIYVITTVFVFLFTGNSDIFKEKLGWWRELIGYRFSKIVKFHRDLFQIEVKRIRLKFFLKKCRTETFPFLRHGTFLRKPLVFCTFVSAVRACQLLNLKKGKFHGNLIIFLYMPH